VRSCEKRACEVRAKLEHRSKELNLENYLIKSVEEAGGRCEKWGVYGWPDRMIFLPGGRSGYLELKRPGGDEEPTPLQYRRIETLNRLGQVADWTKSKEGVDAFIKRLQELPARR
jgi:hypothetical protein